MVGESPTSNRSGSSRGDLATTGGLVPNHLLHMGGRIVGGHAGCEVAIVAFEFHRRDRSRAIERGKLGARGLRVAACLASCIGHELLLITVHLALNLRVVSLMSPRRERGLRRVWVRRRCPGGAGALRGKVGWVETRQRWQAQAGSSS